MTSKSPTSITQWTQAIYWSLLSNLVMQSISRLFVIIFILVTRLHSSRMRTAHALTISPSMLCARGCMLLGGALSRGCIVQGVPAPGGMHGSGGCLVWGVPGLGGRVVVSQHALRQIPPPVNRMTNRCKNITLPQTCLRAVIKLDIGNLAVTSVRIWIWVKYLYLYLSLKVLTY